MPGAVILVPRDFSVLSWGCLLYPLFASNPESGCLFFLGLRFPESCDVMTATASRWWHSPVLFLISSGIRFFLLFVVGFSTGGHTSLLLSALSVLNSFLFYRLLFLCCICFEAATSTCSSHSWDSYSGGHIMCHASMRRSHCWLRFWVVVVMISDWYFSMLSFQHLHDVIYIRLIQTNKPVTRLLRILPL